jgi:hypothetical protein
MRNSGARTERKEEICKHVKNISESVRDRGNDDNGGGGMA